MPFYIRDSVSVGPFRFNLSKSGIGISAGVRGFRIGTGPRGHYIHAGRDGLYYRTSIPSGKSEGSRSSGPTPAATLAPKLAPSSDPSIAMRAVSSGSVEQMVDARFSEILEDINRTRNQDSLTVITVSAGFAVGVALVLFLGAGALPLSILPIALGWVLGRHIDTNRRTSVLMYELDDSARQAYEALTAAFDTLTRCKRKWHIDAGGAVTDLHSWKRNAGAGHVVDKRPTVFEYALPTSIQSNITPPAIQSGKETLYFLPDFLLVVHGSKVGAVAYDELSITWQDTPFIEEEAPPSDSTIIDYVWKYPNKSGGPDRRFRDNRQLPVCLYESFHLKSGNGLNELLQVSTTGCAGPFSDALRGLVSANGSAANTETLPMLTS